MKSFHLTFLHLKFDLSFLDLGVFFFNVGDFAGLGLLQLISGLLYETVMLHHIITSLLDLISQDFLLGLQLTDVFFFIVK